MTGRPSKKRGPEPEGAPSREEENDDLELSDESPGQRILVMVGEIAWITPGREQVIHHQRTALVMAAPEEKPWPWLTYYETLEDYEQRIACFDGPFGDVARGLWQRASKRGECAERKEGA